jgi:hypothetical protein
MALDASIYARFQPKSVADFDREYADLDNARQTNALNKLRLLAGQREMQAADRATAEQDGVRNALSGLGAGATDDQRANALLGLGTQTGFAQADALRKAALERRKTEAEIGSKGSENEARQFKTAHERLTAWNNLLAGVTDEASFQAAIPQAVALGVPAEQLPKAFDPNVVATARRLALTEQQRLETAARARGLDLTAAAQAEAARHNQAGERNAAGQLAVSQGNLGVSRQRLALDQSAPKGQIIETADGFMLADPRAGTAAPLKSASGEPVKGKAGAADKSSEGERTAAGFLLRMRNAEPLVNEFEEKGRPTYTTDAAAAVGGSAARRLVTNETQQKYRQAQEDWVRAKLRKESGAAIPTEEMAREIETYFPQPGEGKEVAKQKKAARKSAEEAMVIAAGRSADKAGAATPDAGAFSDAEKERRYQEWKRKQK